ncbi:MAG: hypothetical protein IPG39_16305 [Bacteroidetes bacterium]|nr:hypothetical protein [Bacteroidota bacterium]
MELEEIRNDRKVIAEIDESITTGGERLKLETFRCFNGLKENCGFNCSRCAGNPYNYRLFDLYKGSPEKDGKELAMEFCDCYENYDKDLSKAYTVF